MKLGQENPYKRSAVLHRIRADERTDAELRIADFEMGRLTDD
jgi:hypothetical protein